MHPLRPATLVTRSAAFHRLDFAYHHDLEESATQHFSIFLPRLIQQQRCIRLSHLITPSKLFSREPWAMPVPCRTNLPFIAMLRLMGATEQHILQMKAHQDAPQAQLSLPLDPHFFTHWIFPTLYASTREALRIVHKN